MIENQYLLAELNKKIVTILNLIEEMTNEYEISAHRTAEVGWEIDAVMNSLTETIIELTEDDTIDKVREIQNLSKDELIQRILKDPKTFHFVLEPSDEIISIYDSTRL